MNIKDRGRLTFIKRLSELSSNSNVQTEDEYDDILKEWDIIGVKTVEKNGQCICGQALNNICIIKNYKTKATCNVGTDCAEKLMGKDYKDYFRIAPTVKKYYKFVNFDIGLYVYKTLNPWEQGFMESLSTRMEYSNEMSDKQAASYYKAYDKLNMMVTADTAIRLFTDFHIYEEQPRRLRELLVEARHYKNKELVVNPLLFSYLVYKGIKTKQEFLEYYGPSLYVYKKNYFYYKDNKTKLLALVDTAISDIL